MSWEELKQEVEELIAERESVPFASITSNGLMSSGDFIKLSGIATQANKITVDTALSSSSANPVSNSIITSRLNMIDQNIQTLNTQITQVEEGWVGKNSATQVKSTITKLLAAIDTANKISTAHNSALEVDGCGSINLCYLGQECFDIVWACSADSWYTYNVTGDFFYMYPDSCSITKPDGASCQYNVDDMKQVVIRLNNMNASLDAGSDYTEIANQLKNDMTKIMRFMDFAGYVIGGYAGYGAPTGTEEKDLYDAWKTTARAYKAYMGAEPTLCWNGVWRR